MEDKNKIQKIVNEISGAKASELSNLRYDIDKDVRLHVMPKIYSKTEPKKKSTKGIGLLILVGGVVLLGVVFYVLYQFLIVPKDTDTPISNSEPVAIEKEIKDEPKVNNPSKDLPVETEEEKAEKVLDIVSEATSTESQISSSSEITKASSTKVINIKEIQMEREFVLARDTDGDGLFDAEEVLFDADINSRDSDSDGYEDLSEFMNMYNPAGAGSLMVNSNIEKYISNYYGYYFYYPYLWSADENGGAESIIFAIGNNQFIQVLVETIGEYNSLDHWYLAQVDEKEVVSEQRMYKKGFEAIKSTNGLNVYLYQKDKPNIFILTYNPGVSESLDYKNVFNMIVKSFEIN